MLVPGTGRDAAFSVSDYNGRAELSARGNSSFYYEKKSYRLELQDEKGKDRKAPLLGMPADSDWVLYASVTDKTFTRNVLGHELWRSTGRYAVRWRFAEVFVITNAFPGAAFKPERLASELPKVLESLTFVRGIPLLTSRATKEVKGFQFPRRAVDALGKNLNRNEALPKKHQQSTTSL